LNRGLAKLAAGDSPSWGRWSEIFMNAKHEINIHESDQIPPD